MMKIGHSMSVRFQISYYQILLKYIVFLFISWGFFFFFSRVKLESLPSTLIITSLGLIFLTYFTAFFGTKINGVRRWLFLWKFGSIQPSELLKNVLTLPVITLLGQSKHYKVLALWGFSAIGCLLQPDLGMTILISSMFVMAIILRGENLRIYFILTIIVILLIIFTCIFITPYGIQRVLIFLGKEKGYQIVQSLTSISNSGMILGSMDEDIYIPDAHCDFMFSAIVNRFGIIISGIFLWWPIWLSQYVLRQKTNDLIVCLLWQFNLQFYLHILSNLAIIPTKGLGLPLVSQGGSGMISFAITFGLLSNLLQKDKEI